MKPTSLVAAALMFIAFGLGSLVTAMAAAVVGRIDVQLGALALVIGIPLLRCNVAAWFIGVGATAITLVTVPIMSAFVLLNRNIAGAIKFLGVPAQNASVSDVLGQTVTWTLLAAIQLWLLIRADTRAALKRGWQTDGAAQAPGATTA